ncbi:MAG: SDR family oxidoreductase [Hoeflea sp.]|uniref:SDR family NAD(P)-dependent oxidoreductase n=1 Tax=Hoeflea sp. TaxID=1940281 RepID=UPI001DA4C331|nr:SDR family NAD(P)-dependent oxidoreductase [Hoeflea sp.]MBU4530329.1 SDR family oxidoreductase [Alphaproteobacteria bacterium]MBU4545116.1 SDR family oxidoreductase [Alphaproteobacteria bacterium]MBU4549684.1 SDR family oxidoreductase [Alphaproteobacteria bacterium]MBV1721919.1 SDR family oxidoreductase [Hoeflea sp.]MBV1761269.1 SDR family oxidoreductase [Hoeflea sp.]
MTSASNQDLQGRVALVTGASRNIGRAIAVALASRGANIAVHVGQDHAAGEETAAAVRAAGGEAHVLSGDLSNPDIARSVVANAAGQFGRLDMVINNAAIRPEAPFAELTYENWRKVMGIALDAVFLVSQAALPHLKASDMASVVNIGGLTGHTGATERAHVITAKAGLVGLTKAMAHELSPLGITINCVSPGLIQTARLGAAAHAPKHHDTRTNLVGHRGSPEDVAEAVAFLCGPASRYITGETLHVNGGAYLA